MSRTLGAGNLRRLEAGVTLIELLVSMALGIVIIGALVMVYTSGSSATRNAQAQQQMNEDAQMALDVLSQELRRTGYNPVRSAGVVNDLAQAGWTLFACDSGFTDITQTNVSALACNAAGTDAAIAMVFEGDDLSGKLTSTGKLMDCIGTGVASTTVATNTFYRMQARLYIANKALRCRGAGDLTQTQVLAENIESMSMQFGVLDPSGGTKNVLGYLSANDVANSVAGGLNALTAVERWNKVASVKICVVVVSEDPVLGDLRDGATAPTYKDCTGANTDILDGKLRRAYRTTVLLRNHGVGYADS
jgi:type IV pilus assembly protein PilW